MDWYGDGMGWWGYAGMGIGIMLLLGLIITAIIAVIAFVVNEQRTPQQPAAQPSSPEQILSMRFARGELTESEYRDRIAVLRDPAAR